MDTQIWGRIIWVKQEQQKRVPDYLALLRQMGVDGAVQGREYRARCPLHQDRNPSFSVNLEIGLWICHARCGSGDFVTLVERVMLLSYPEAKEWVESNGQKVNISSLQDQLTQLLNPFDKTEVPVKEEWRVYYDSLPSMVMPKWFMDRGFTSHTVMYWGIKYDAAVNAVVIPVRWKEDLVGIIIRKFTGEPKYKNSPNLPKANIFFGYILDNRKEIIICEGVLDALWLWQCGYNAVSILGDSISRRQIGILREHRFGEIILCLDNDEAGRLGQAKATQLLLEGGYLLPQVQTIRLPGYKKEDIGYKKDPQDCSPDEFLSYFQERKVVTIGGLAS